MPPVMRSHAKPTVVIYGATSFTARHLLSYLDTHPEEEGFEFILAGRNREKLDAANGRLGRRREVMVIDLSVEEGVRRMVQKASVIINLAGPFRWYNAEAIIRECAENGKHYVDLSAEATWLSKTIIPRYDFLASKTGACIVPSCGFDSVPSDLILYSAHRALRESSPPTTISKSMSFFKSQATVSGGTIASFYSIAELPREERVSGEWDLTSPLSRSDRPSTPPQALYTLHSPGLGTTLYGAFFFMYPYNRAIVRRSQFLSRTAEACMPSGNWNDAADVNGREPDNAKAPEPVYGDDLEYAEAIQMPGPIRAFVFSAVSFLFLGLFFSSGLVRKICSFILPSPGQGASQDKLEKGWYKITNISTSTTPFVEVKTTFYGKGDPGYINSCYLLAESALSLVLPPPSSTSLPPLARRGGVLTPATAMGEVLVERLRRSGKVEIQSEVLISGESKKTK